MNNLNQLSKECHKYSRTKGFWDGPTNIGEKLMLIVSEVSEALEADRKGRKADLQKFNAREEDKEEFHFESDFQQTIKDTFEDEIADVFIRLFDLCGGLGIDIERHIELKIKYNQTRPYKHGKKY